MGSEVISEAGSGGHSSGIGSANISFGCLARGCPAPGEIDVIGVDLCIEPQPCGNLPRLSHR